MFNTKHNGKQARAAVMPEACAVALLMATDGAQAAGATLLALEGRPATIGATLTPAEARQLASELEHAADEAAHCAALRHPSMEGPCYLEADPGGPVRMPSDFGPLDGDDGEADKHEELAT
jgi:hypothetical protein